MGTNPRRWLSALLAGGLLVATAASCGDDGDSGSGGLPEAVPADFPLPADAEVLGSSFDAAANRAEFTIEAEEEMTVHVTFFTLELVSRGYVVERSVGTPEGWLVEYRRGELDGTISLSRIGDATRAVVVIDRP
jgi:hypothetical protein